MKHNHYLSVIIILLTVFCLVLSGCQNMPKKQDKPSQQESTSEQGPSETDSEMLIQNNHDTAPEGTDGNDNAAESEDNMIHNNSMDEDIYFADPPKDNDDEILINRDHSSVFYPKTASLSFRPTTTITGGNAQIVKPTSSADSDLVIKNDHNITYPETQTLIQKSVPSGQLQPLSYIPPSQLANGQSIAFAPGATSAVISGYVPAGGVVSYNFYAFANQNFLALLTSDSGTSVLGVSDVYGNVFLDANQRQNSYNMYLPRTATYYVNIYSTGYSENFTLQIFIPARVTIPTGQTSTSMSGTLAPYSVVSYTAYMYAGQTARIDDYSGPQPNSFLRVSGLQTGMVYMDYTAYSPSWYSVVPVTQDYLIEVISIDQTSNYRLTVDVR